MIKIITWKIKHFAGKFYNDSPVYRFEDNFYVIYKHKLNPPTLLLRGVNRLQKTIEIEL